VGAGKASTSTSMSTIRRGGIPLFNSPIVLVLLLVLVLDPLQVVGGSRKGEHENEHEHEIEDD
jgi:hypothetical protein